VGEPGAQLQRFPLVAKQSVMNRWLVREEIRATDGGK